jgi:DNA-binding MarR family transcriptional regulator
MSGRIMDRCCADIVSSVKDIPESGAQRQAAEVLAAEVLAAISAVRRVARRAARSAGQAQPLPPAQSELLQLAAARPGISVADAARELRLAPNTVSTLVGRLTSAGLLARTRAVSDGRSVWLTVTGNGAQRIAEWRDLRADLAGRALDQLTAGDRQALADAVPALLRFAAQMEEES